VEAGLVDISPTSRLHPPIECRGNVVAWQRHIVARRDLRLLCSLDGELLWGHVAAAYGRHRVNVDTNAASQSLSLEGFVEMDFVALHVLV